jgi:hypothetical protein
MRRIAILMSPLTKTFHSYNRANYVGVYVLMLPDPWKCLFGDMAEKYRFGCRTASEAAVFQLLMNRESTPIKWKRWSSHLLPNLWHSSDFLSNAKPNQILILLWKPTEY